MKTLIPALYLPIPDGDNAAELPPNPLISLPPLPGTRPAAPGHPPLNLPLPAAPPPSAPSSTSPGSEAFPASDPVGWPVFGAESARIPAGLSPAFSSATGRRFYVSKPTFYDYSTLRAMEQRLHRLNWMGEHLGAQLSSLHSTITARAAAARSFYCSAAATAPNPGMYLAAAAAVSAALYRVETALTAITSHPGGPYPFAAEAAFTATSLHLTNSIFFNAEHAATRNLATTNYFPLSVFPALAIAKQLANISTQDLLRFAAWAMSDTDFPEEFTLQGHTFLAKQLSAESRIALQTAWLLERIGTDQGLPDLGQVRVKSAAGIAVIPVPRLADSPQFDSYMSEWYAKNLPAPAVLREAVARLEAGDKAGFVKEFLTGEHGGSYSGMLLGVTGVYLLHNGQTQREAANQAWLSSPTARKVGIAESDRLRVRREAPPVRLDKIIKAADTIDPYQGGALEIQSWTTADGQRAHRVMLRGTQDWDAGSVQPQDMAANLQAVGQAPSAQLLAVTAAMEQAGIRPDDPVQIFGHSQAGIIAAQLASVEYKEAPWGCDFNIRSIITAGSPVAGYDLREGVRALHLENLDDPVPLLEGSFNPADERRVTVYASARAGESVHGRDTYERIAAELIAGGDTRVGNLLKDMNHDLGLDGKISGATAQRIETARVR